MGRISAALERWASTPRLWLQGLLLAVVLFALLPVVLDGNGIGYPDEGVYAAQVESLSRGTWWEERPAADLPGLEIANGMGPEFAAGDRYVGYVRHSLYMRLLVPFWRIGGFAALLVPSILGGVLAALATAFLARHLDRRVAVPGLWMVAVGSPLLFDSYLIAAHTLGAAAVGWSAVGIAGILRTKQFRALFWVLPVAAFAVFMRSEGVLYVGGLAAGVGALAVARAVRRRWPDALRLGAASVSLGAVGASTFLVDAWLARGITGSVAGPETTSRVLGETTDPLAHVWASLLRPGIGTAISWQPLLAAVALVFAAALYRLAGPRAVLLQVGLLGLAAGSALWMHADTLGLITGLVAAFPLLVAGLIVTPRFRGDDLRWFLAIGSTAALPALILAGYAEGGASEWGGRFYLPLVVLVAPLMLAGLERWVRELQGEGRLVVAMFALIVFSTGALQVRLNRDRRAVTSIVDRGVASVLHRSESTGRPLVIAGGISIGGGGRILWARRDEVQVLSAPSLENTFRMVTFLAKGGYRDLYVLIPMPDGMVHQVAEAWLQPIRWEIGPRHSLGTTGFALYRLFAPPRKG